MSGSPITDYKAPQWFRMQPILPLRDSLHLPRGGGFASPAWLWHRIPVDVQLAILKVAYLLSLHVFTQAAHCFYKAPYAEDKC